MIFMKKKHIYLVIYLVSFFIHLNGKTSSHLTTKAPTNKNFCDNKIEVDPDIRFDTLVGQSEAKKRLTSIASYCENPEPFERGGIEIDNGYLLAGPSSCRYDMMCVGNALVNELNSALKEKEEDHFNYYIIFSDLILAKGLRWFSKEVKKHAPCVIYIHDVDWLSEKWRGGSYELMNQILAFIFNPNFHDNIKNKIFFLATTNSPQNVRIGMFSSYIPFELPNQEQRKALFQREVIARGQNADDYNFDQLAAQTDGYRSEDLSDTVEGAMQIAQKKNRHMTQDDLEISVATRLWWFEDKISEEKLWG